MRYIATNNLRPGYKIASSLTSSGAVLLRKGVVLTRSIIKRVTLLGYQGLYIEDEISEGLDIADVISSDLRSKTRRELQQLFFNVEKGVPSRAITHIKNIKSLGKDIVDEILCNRHAMINLIDLRTFDDYTYSHSMNVTVLSVVLGTALRLSRNAIYELAIGALIHDTGKMFIEKKILNKPGKLSAEEYEDIKKHSELGYQYLCNNPDIPDSAKIATLHHHEQYNGNGYPGGLAAEDIHQFGRIISAADVYDALTSDRPYRKAMLPSDAIEYIMSGFGTMFDPDIVKAFTKKVAPYPIGTCIRLSSGDMGIVIKNYEETSLRPMVKLIEDNKPTDRIVDLSHDRSSLSITVKEIVNL
jgi:HD-GYP domain-containing protein (c-di-GMP phosphodiesterase class II)